MADSIKINKLEIENVKRIKAVKIEPTKNGLTIVGGNNNQGKTSVLDSIAWALGGDRYKPSNATRDGSTIPPNLHIVMSNGLVVERKGKNSSLKVTDPNGNKGGQQLLNDFVEQLALDLPKFMESSGKEKAQTLLKIIGVGDQLTALEQQEKELYNERLYVGRTADQKVKFAKEQPYYPDAPKDLVSPSDLIKQQQEILARNGKNEEYRRNAVNMKAEYDSLNMEIENLRKMLQEKMERYEALSEALEAANKTVSEGGKRTMYTQHHPCWDAKNRFGLPEECEFDYSVIAEIIEGTKKSVPAPKEEKPIEIQKPSVKDNDFMNIPKDTDEKVDFDTGAKVEEPVKSTGTKVEDSVFHIAEYIPKALRDLMYPNLVSEEELMEAVYQRGFFPKGTPFQNLPQEFVDGCLIGAWPQVLDVIKTMRSHYDIPFDK